MRTLRHPTWAVWVWYFFDGDLRPLGWRRRPWILSDRVQRYCVLSHCVRGRTVISWVAANRKGVNCPTLS
ncbi:hypothetical protein RSAG8_04470, partial [Rhizoctonia solani AG-8 WAC10335]